MRRDKHCPWNRTTIPEDELGVLRYQWLTSRIQQPDLALGALYKQDVYNSGFEKNPPDKYMKRLSEKLFKKILWKNWYSCIESEGWPTFIGH